VAWQQLILRLRAEELPQAEALLRLAGAQAVAIGAATDDPIFEPGPGAAPLWSRVEIRALFAGDVDLGRLAALLEGAVQSASGPAIAPLEDRDWLGAWRQRITPRAFGGGFWVVPADAPADVPDGCRLRLHMGLAFGTGQHATTAMCLEWLAAHPPRAATVLDFGCGSGVLALAALKLGARRAWAVDHDPQAIAATEENARLNDLGESLWVGSPDALPRVQVDLILANIVAGTLVGLVPRFAALAKPGASIVLTGILADQAAAVELAYGADFADFDRASSDGWVRIMARRQAAVRNNVLAAPA
jgi:ribosomal protein L11 methyltransferase